MVDIGLPVKIIPDIVGFLQRANKIEQAITVVLYAAGVTPKIIPKIRQFYKCKDCLQALTEDPYKISAIKGIGFLTADKVALCLGIDPMGQTRLCKAIHYVMTKMAYENGHTAVNAMQIIAGVKDLIGVDMGVDEIDRSEVCQKAYGLYLLPKFFDIENNIAASVASIIGRQSKICAEISDDNIRACASKIVPGQLTEQQIHGIKQALLSPISVISGGPGTGKSASIQVICTIAEQQGLNIAVVAPTGRAAERIKEDAPYIKTSTIHRRLKWLGFGWRKFMFNADNPLDVDMVIVDETSMLGVELAYDLLQAIGKANICFVGDKDQLPSVDPGNFLASLLMCKSIPTTILSQIFRQKHGSGIIYACSLANTGQFWTPKKERFDYQVVDANKENWFRVFKNTYIKALEQHKHVQVIAPLKRGMVSTASLNAICQKIANPQGKYAANGIKEGDRVIQIRNRYQKNIFNGDIGIVCEWETIRDENDASDLSMPMEDVGERVLVVQFGKNKYVGYLKQELADLEIAYACTVHKLQGGGFDCVICCIMMSHYILLDRNLIYTGMSRAKKQLIMFGEKRAMFYGVKTETSQARVSMLQYLLAEI